MIRDQARWQCRWRIDKHRPGSPPERVEGEGNLLTSAGIGLIWTALVGGAYTPFGSAQARLGVGDSSAAEDEGQTDLQAASNKHRKAMDSGYPAIAGHAVAFRASFGGGDANFAWNEWGVFNAASGGTMLNRKVQAIGTKASGSTWVLTVTISLA